MVSCAAVVSSSISRATGGSSRAPAWGAGRHHTARLCCTPSVRGQGSLSEECVLMTTGRTQPAWLPWKGQEFHNCPRCRRDAHRMQAPQKCKDSGNTPPVWFWGGRVGYSGIEALKVARPASAEGPISCSHERVSNNHSGNDGGAPTGCLVPWAVTGTLWGGCKSYPCSWLKEVGEVAFPGPGGSRPRPSRRAMCPPGTHRPAFGRPRSSWGLQAAPRPPSYGDTLRRSQLSVTGRWEWGRAGFPEGHVYCVGFCSG